MFPEGRALEFLIAGVIALIVVGPKDLPVLMRKLGQAIGRLRALAAEFRASFDEMARQSELDELRKEVQAMRQAQLADAASLHNELKSSLDEINDGLSDGPAPAADRVAASTPAPAKAAKPRTKRSPTKPKTTRSRAAAPAAKPRRKPTEPKA
jgi:sec-independent protein translocase protein TatB